LRAAAGKIPRVAFYPLEEIITRGKNMSPLKKKSLARFNIIGSPEGKSVGRFRQVLDGGERFYGLSLFGGYGVFITAPR
jgi:hypothetical protein